MLLLRLGGLRFPLLGGLLVGSIRLYDRVEVVDKREREKRGKDRREWIDKLELSVWEWKWE